MNTSNPIAWPVQVERIATGLHANVIHGWHSSRLLRYAGGLIASGTVSASTARDFSDVGVVYRRRPSGEWIAQPTSVAHLYTTLIDRLGRLWVTSHYGYSHVGVLRSRATLDASRFEVMYNGTNAYMGLGISPEDNVLLLYATYDHMGINQPNAVTAAFYERRTRRWHTSQMDTPEGRYGYMGIVLRGRSAIAVLNSSLLDPTGNPVPPHFTWRHVRLARCDDLTRGEWRMVPWLMPDFGHTALQDMIVAPDGGIYLAYSHLSGRSFEEIDGRPIPHYVARIHEDLSVDAFPTGLRASATRLFVDRAGGWHAVGRPEEGGDLRLWTLDPRAGFKPTREYALPGTAPLEGYVIHTLRPERFGGENDGDTVHLMTAGYTYNERGAPKSADLWHAWFDLPTGL